MSKQTDKRQENFPIASFRFLERKISRLRRSVMFVAARIAREEAPADQQIFTVEQKHVEAAWKRVIEAFAKSH